MSNDIIIEEFEDRRWMRSEVFQELIRVAGAKKLLEKDANCGTCGEDAEDGSDLKDNYRVLDVDDDYWTEAIQYVSDSAAEEEINYAEDEKKFSELAISLMKKAEKLLDEGNAAEALEVERKIWQIKHNLRKMKQIANSQVEE